MTDLVNRVLLIENLLNSYETLRLDQPCSTSCISSPEPQPVCAEVRESKRDWKPNQKSSLIVPVTMRCRDTSCNSTDILEDAGTGSVVCIQCGMIQCMFMLENAHTYAPYHQGVSPTAVHRYSRIVYLRAILLGLRGDTRANLELGDLMELEWFFHEDEDHRKWPKTASSIRKAIKLLKLPSRLLRHTSVIAWHLWKTKCPLPNESDIRDIIRLFRAYENVWEREPLGGSVRQGRKKFIAYSVIWNYLAQKLGHQALVNLLPPLKNKKLVRTQTLILDAMALKV